MSSIHGIGVSSQNLQSFQSGISDSERVNRIAKGKIEELTKALDSGHGVQVAVDLHVTNLTAQATQLNTMIGKIWEQVSSHTEPCPVLLNLHNQAVQLKADNLAMQERLLRLEEPKNQDLEAEVARTAPKAKGFFAWIRSFFS